jgi:hypothetical protein
MSQIGTHVSLSDRQFAKKSANVPAKVGLYVSAVSEASKQQLHCLACRRREELVSLAARVINRKYGVGDVGRVMTSNFKYKEGMET